MSSTSLIRSLWNIILPLDCAVCRQLLPEQAELSICESCRLELEPRGSRCRFCGVSLGDFHPDQHCRHCPETPFRFERIVALGGYDDRLREIVLRMKHISGERLAITCGELLGESYLRESGESLPQVVVPAPMFWLRRLTRGVNGPDLLATRIARVLRIDVVLDGLFWQRICAKQSNLSLTNRRTNVRNALSASASYDFQGCHVLFVDDVVTTGATAREAARALLEAGASRVTVATVARGANT